MNILLWQRTDLQHLILGIFVADMGVGIQRDSDVAVSHNVLQRLGIHAGFCHIGAEGVSAYMGCDFWHLHPVNAVILVANVLKILLPVQCHHGHPILVQIEETAFSADEGLFFLLLSVCNNGRKAIPHLRCHGHHSGAAAGLCGLNDILHIPCALQLVIDNNAVIFEVNVVNCQPNELRNAKSRLEENEDPLVVFAEMWIIFFDLCGLFLFRTYRLLSWNTVTVEKSRAMID